jgi:type II secretory pathway pseudopilin PulG
MDDAFRMVAARMPRTRRLSPFAVRAVALLTVIALLLAAFAMFVVSAQRTADARRAQLAATQRAEAEAEAQAAAAPVGAVDPGTADPTAVGNMLDAHAQAAATTAFDAAQQIAAGGSIADAAPNALTAVAPTVLFIEGPSTGPSVVSVYAGAAGWAAAVHGAKATCYWVAVAADGRTRYGIGSACTGMAALAADRPAW